MQQEEGDFDKILPGQIKAESARSGNERLIPLEKVREAIGIANRHLIAVLGIEVFRISSSGHVTKGYSGYDFKFDGNWPGFVSQNNKSAAEYINQHPLGEGHGYILTTVSENEFAHLRDRINGKQ